RLVGGAEDGGIAEFVRAPEYALHPLPPSVAARDGHLVEPLAVALHALRSAWPTPGDEVLVIGAGTIGLTCTLVAATSGARVTTVARHPHQQRAAERLGAQRVIKSVAALPSEAFQLVLETVGTSDAVMAATSAARRRATLLLLAHNEGP